jgi:hypothetical protein
MGHGRCLWNYSRKNKKGDITVVRKQLILFALTSLLLVAYVLAGPSQETTPSHGQDEEAIRQTIHSYEQMFVSEDLKTLDEVFHPLAMLCWQSENPHTLSREDCREDLRETFGRRNYRYVKIYDMQINIAGNVAELSCKEIHSMEGVDIDDKYLVDMIFVHAQGRWRILTKITTRQTNRNESKGSFVPNLVEDIFTEPL